MRVQGSSAGSACAALLCAAACSGRMQPSAAAGRRRQVISNPCKGRCSPACNPRVAACTPCGRKFLILNSKPDTLLHVTHVVIALVLLLVTGHVVIGVLGRGVVILLVRVRGGGSGGSQESAGGGGGGGDDVPVRSGRVAKRGPRQREHARPRRRRGRGQLRRCQAVDDLLALIFYSAGCPSRPTAGCRSPCCCGQPLLLAGGRL